MKTVRSFDLVPIGVIHSPYQKRGDAPHQGRLAPTTSEIEIFPEYAAGLKDIARLSHLIILYWLDRANRQMLTAVPPHSKKEYGVFATRSPNRPNPIGFAVTDLLNIDGQRLIARGLDALDGTPVLDLKPYSPEIDCVKE
ncbi:MAG: tRNA (N6-threonylcarbamoyladenosine(37)-N6)-methyltransferase TrmO [Syntrophaceae bacterium]